MPRKPAKTHLTDSKMKAKLQDAAEYIGTTPEGLIRMVIDAGLVTQTEPIGDNLSLEKLGQTLAVQMADTPSDSRDEWFSGLTDIQQAAIVVNRRRKGYAPASVGIEFGISANKVSRIYNQYADNIGANVLEQRQTTVAGIIQMQADAMMEKISALRTDSESDESYSELAKQDLIWKIFKESQKMLRDIGVVSEAPKKHDVTIHQPDQDTLRMQEELTKKRKRREIEIGVVDEAEREDPGRERDPGPDIQEAGDGATQDAHDDP